MEARLGDSDQAIDFARRFENIFAYDAESWQETNANFLGIFQMQDTITGFVVAAILAVGGFGILAIQIIIVLQKTRDIAILRSVGFHRNDILRLSVAGGHHRSGRRGGGRLDWSLSHRRALHLKTHQEGLVKSEYFLVFDDPSMYRYG